MESRRKTTEWEKEDNIQHKHPLALQSLGLPRGNSWVSLRLSQGLHVSQTKASMLALSRGESRATNQ